MRFVLTFELEGDDEIAVWTPDGAEEGKVMRLAATMLAPVELLDWRCVGFSVKRGDSA